MSRHPGPGTTGRAGRRMGRELKRGGGGIKHLLRIIPLDPDLQDTGDDDPDPDEPAAASQPEDEAA